MDVYLEHVDNRIEETGADGFLIEAAGDDGNQRYLSGFNAHDPFISLYTGDAVAILIGGTDYSRATKESHADAVRRHADYTAEGGESPDPKTEKYDAIIGFLREHDVSHVFVPEAFPLGTARVLEQRDVTVAVDASESLLHDRTVKTEREVVAIEKTQRATEAAMERAESILREATIDEEVLTYGGDTLTGARLKSEIETTLLREGAALQETIVACGRDSADPHGQTDGPLSPHQSILIDIFPEHIESGYHADMTRTFVKGEPSEELETLYRDVHAALEAALESLGPGVTGDTVCQEIHDMFRAAGHQTVLDDDGIDAGALHSGGHGVGLEVHELPSVRPGGAAFEVGNVITIEPGLYYPDIGGVRLEDLVEITETGYNNLTDFSTQLVIE